MARGRCGLLAQPHGGFAAVGSARNVAIAAAVYGVVQGVQMKETFDNCMLANGEQIVDGQPVVAAAPVIAAPAPAAPVDLAMAAPAPVVEPQAAPPVMQPTPVMAPIPVVAAPVSVPVALPVGPAAIQAPPYPATIDDNAAQAQRAAQAWLVAEGILNRPNVSPEKQKLYGVLCGTGDQSSCLMAQAFGQKPR